MSTPEPSHAVDLGEAGATTVLAVEGMHCASCVALVEESLTEQPGVASASVSLDEERAVVRYDPATVTPEHLATVVADTGYPARPTG